MPSCRTSAAATTNGCSGKSASAGRCGIQSAFHRAGSARSPRYRSATSQRKLTSAPVAFRAVPLAHHLRGLGALPTRRPRHPSQPRRREDDPPLCTPRSSCTSSRCASTRTWPACPRRTPPPCSPEPTSWGNALSLCVSVPAHPATPSDILPGHVTCGGGELLVLLRLRRVLADCRAGHPHDLAYRDRAVDVSTRSARHHVGENCHSITPTR